MSDRFAQVKKTVYEFINIQGMEIYPEDLEWLIAEVERLRHLIKEVGAAHAISEFRRVEGRWPVIINEENGSTLGGTPAENVSRGISAENIVLPDPEITRISVNPSKINQNQNNNTCEAVLVVRVGDAEPVYALGAVIHGPSRVVYDPGGHPAGGIRVWVETEAAVDLEFEVDIP